MLNKRKIGILTLPISFTMNYGAIIQSLALLETIKKLGYEPYMIKKRHKMPPHIYYLFVKAKHTVNLIRGKKEYLTTSRKEYIERTDLMCAYTRLFVNKHIQPQTEVFYNSSDFRKLDKFDAIIVGSDQVWRPRYTANIYDYYLKYINDEEQVKRIAYATSFGTNKWEYTNRQTKKCKRLIHKFDAISVREDSAKQLCLDKFGIVAEQVLDPSLLLTAEDYIDKLDLISTNKNQGYLFSYFLDQDVEKETLTRSIELESGLKRISINLKKFTDESLTPAEPVEEWIQKIYDADFVITDSFHGCTFSILFNKPFIAIGNAKRGLSRVESLLSLFELTNRLITSWTNTQELDIKRLAKESIDWDKVNSILKIEREKSLTFLRNALD